MFLVTHFSIVLYVQRNFTGEKISHEYNYPCTGAGEASADVPDGEEDKAKDDNAVGEGELNYIFFKINVSE